MTQTIGLIGIGNMGTALLNGFINSNAVSKESILVFDKDTEKLQKLAKELDISKTSSTTELLNSSSIIFICVKPQNIQELMDEIISSLSNEAINEKLFISVLAGTPLNYFQENLGSRARIIRLMPNTPCLVNAGMIALSKNNNVKEEESIFIQKLLNPTGEIIETDENYIDAITALSGSGPAYIFMLIQAMTNAGMKIGLSQEQSLKLAAQTTYGAAKLVLSHGEHPEVLKDRVASPAGTTIHALQELEEAGFRGTVMKSVEKSYQRSKELNNKESKE